MIKTGRKWLSAPLRRRYEVWATVVSGAAAAAAPGAAAAAVGV